MAMRVALVVGYAQSNCSTSIVRFADGSPCRYSSLYGWPNADADNLATGGSIWAPLLDKLRMRGVDAALFNHAVGSTGILFNWSGYLTTHALDATFSAGRYVKVGANIYRANGAAGTSFKSDASAPPAWGNTVGQSYAEATGGGSWTCVFVNTTDVPGKLYAPGDALYDPLGLVGGVRSRIATLAPRFDKVINIIQGGQSDYGQSQPLYETAHVNFINYMLPAGANVECAVGVTPRRWDGAYPAAWDTFYKPARENIVRAFSGNRRVWRGGDCSTVTSDMMLDESGQLIHVIKSGRDECVRQWLAAFDASGVY